VNSLLAFDGSGSSDEDGTILSHEWDFGDGGVASGATPTHSYGYTGVYQVTLTVTDDDGQESSEIMYVAIYDPSAGFVTGGGWISSPAGAYAIDPLLSGKASFGFVAKYQKGATVPSGETQFQFHVGNLDFKSTSYQWLVVSGSKAKYKGSGTINGSGDYGFMLSAVDGQIKGDGADKFRIKIWEETTGQVVYDNQMGAADDGDAATAIGGGNIVIHTK
jgi:hypothetical protein